MALQTINIGTLANDGTGDDLREAFVKVNANFNELDLRAPERTTGANLGSAGEGVFAQLSGSEMQFKKIIGGTAVTLASDGNAITINSTATKVRYRTRRSTHSKGQRKRSSSSS